MYILCKNMSKEKYSTFPPILFQNCLVLFSIFNRTQIVQKLKWKLAIEGAASGVNY